MKVSKKKLSKELELDREAPISEGEGVVWGLHPFLYKVIVITLCAVVPSARGGGWTSPTLT